MIEFRLDDCALVWHDDSKRRVGEPDRPVGCHGEIVGRIDPLAQIMRDDRFPVACDSRPPASWQTACSDSPSLPVPITAQWGVRKYADQLGEEMYRRRLRYNRINWGYARDEWERRTLDELFEKNESQAELLEGDAFVLRGLQRNFCIRPRLN